MRDGNSSSRRQLLLHSRNRSRSRSRAAMGGGGGGRGKSRTQRKHFAQNRDNTWKRSKADPSAVDSGDNANGNGGANTPWQPFSTQNPSFDAYYKEQGIVSPEEWDAFTAYLRKPLPAAFRINSSSQFCSDIKSQLENDFYKSLQSEFEGDEAEAIRPLPWYPENLAWHSNFSRMQLRKNQALERFHEFLKLENEIGNITRQEAVSMVPPLFLDVHPSHSVLDMCAAPGSKTFQLLEIIHRSTEPGSLPDGLVVANDLDVQRCNLLIHQTKRMCTANLVVTNHEAQQFPGCRLSKGSSNASETDTQSETSLSQLVFDRVLCDVPCSGDGTLRKAPDIWRKWNSGMGNGLHGLQVQIASRGLALVKVGGRMVYSTCSMNPIENEAVVATILRKYEGCVELLDVSNELPQLVRRPGLRKWKVYDKTTWLASYKDVKKYRRGGVIPSMFPSGQNSHEVTEDDAPEDNQSGDQATNTEDNVTPPENPITPPENLEAEVSDLPLERCMRIVPHDQNAGAFFIAVLRKTAPLPANAEMPIKQGKTSSRSDVNGKSAADTSNDQVVEAVDDKVVPESSVTNNVSSKETELEEEAKAAGRKRKLQMQGKWRGVDPVVFFKDDAILNSIKSFYGIVDSFPLDGHLVTRNSDTNHVKRIYYISKSVKQALDLNFKVGQPLKITSIGLKMFERQSSLQGTTAPCVFRVSSEGLPMLLPYITKQILYASAVDFKHLLQYKSVKFSDFVDSEFGSKAVELLSGCCVIVLKNDSDTNMVTTSKIAIGCWKGRNSLSVLVTAIDCQELLERLLARVEVRAKKASADAADEEMQNAEGGDDVTTTAAQV